MRTLWLLRHAKSSWDDDSLPDHDRPLAPRGRRAASELASWAEREGPRPDLVLSSTATRARDTLASLLPHLGEADLRYEDDLYTFDASAVIATVRQVADDVAVLLVVGHNPAIQETVLTLAARGDRLDEVSAKFPTGALARLDLAVDRWHDVGAATGELTTFVTPKDLGGQTR